MVDSPMMPVSRRPRRSFLNETEDDPAYRQWLIEKGHVDLAAGDQFEENMLGEKTGRVQREGSTFMEVDDPTQPGGKRYVARRNSQVDMPANARVMSFKDGFGNDKPYVTKDKTYRPNIAPSVAAKYSGDYAADEKLKRAEAERLREKAEADEAETQKRAAREAEAQAQDDRGIATAVKRARAMREIQQEDPLYARRQGQDIAAFDDADAKRNRRTKRRDMLEAGDDIPGLSQNAERSAAASLREGMDLEDAEAVARRTHEADVAEIQRLEASGDPDAIEQAQTLRESDPDLRGVRSFLDPSAGRRRNLDEQATLADIGGSLASEESLAPEQPLLSARNAVPVFGAAKLGADLLKRAFRDTDAENRLTQPKVDAALIRLQQAVPGMTREQAAEKVRSFLIQRGAPPERVNALVG